jgi:hypothetical protein
MIPQRVLQRSSTPKYLTNLGLNKFAPDFSLAFAGDHFHFYFDSVNNKMTFAAAKDLGWKIGMTDLLIELFTQSKSLPSEREMISFLKDDAYQEFPVVGSDQDQFLKQLVLHFNRFLFQQQKAALIWSSASIVDKLNAVKAVLAMHYKGIELIDVDEDTVVVNLGDSGKCEGDKILESLQDYLQYQLKSHKINVIPEF